MAPPAWLHVLIMDKVQWSNLLFDKAGCLFHFRWTKWLIWANMQQSICCLIACDDDKTCCFWINVWIVECVIFIMVQLDRVDGLCSKHIILWKSNGTMCNEYSKCSGTWRRCCWIRIGITIGCYNRRYHLHGCHKDDSTSLPTCSLVQKETAAFNSE